jgi:hypothetical protein
MTQLFKQDLSFETKIKLIIKNNTFRLAHRLAIRRIKKLAKNSKPIPPVKKDGKKIIFNLLYGMYGRLIFWECGLAKAMQLRGHNIKVITCDKKLTMCTSEFTIGSAHDEKTCDHCVKFSGGFLKAAGLLQISYNQYITENEIKKIHERVNKLSLEECGKLVYKDVEVGPLSINAALRYFEGTLNPDPALYERVLRAELINSIIATDIAEKIYQDEKPDIIVTTHLGYSSWGSFDEYCRRKGVSLTYPGDGYIPGTIAMDFNIKEKTKHFFKRFYEDIKQKQPLNKKEQQELQTFIGNRIHGKEGDTAIYEYGKEDAKKQFNTEKYKKTYAMFPNVAWDSSLLYADRGFKNVYDWVSYTVQIFKNKPDYQLIIKIHPSEAYVAKSKNTVADFIIDKYSPIPENIKIIPPVTNISPYSLFTFIDAGIVYNGTIGLEMALQNVPVVVAGITHYAENGFTYDVQDKKHYEKLLFNNLSRLTEKQMEIAKAYGYFYFKKSFVKYDLVYKKNILNQGWKIQSFDDLEEGKNKFLDIICEYIANDDIYQKW